MHRALQWLLANNIYCRANQISIDQNTLGRLPQDGNLSNLASVAVESPDVGNQQVPTTEEGDPYDAHLAISFAPIATWSMTEQEAVCHSVQQRQSGQPSVSTSVTIP